MDTLIIVCKAIVIAGIATLVIMGGAVFLASFFPNLQDHPACKEADDE